VPTEHEAGSALERGLGVVTNSTLFPGRLVQRRASVSHPSSHLKESRCHEFFTYPPTSLTNSVYLTKHHAMKTYWGAGIAPRILDLGTRRRWVVIFTSLPLYP